MENKTGFSLSNTAQRQDNFFGSGDDWNLSVWICTSLGFSALWAPHSYCRHCCIPVDSPLLLSWVKSEHPPEGLSLKTSEQFQTPLQLQGMWCLGLRWLWVGSLEWIWVTEEAWAVFKQKGFCGQSSSVKPPGTPQENWDSTWLQWYRLPSSWDKAAHPCFTVLLTVFTDGMKPSYSRSRLGGNFISWLVLIFSRGETRPEGVKGCTF